MTADQTLKSAIRHHQAGKLSEAEAIYRQILSAEPNHADALHLLGVIAHQVGKNQVAVELIGRAIAMNPSIAIYHNNMGLAQSALGQAEAACASYRRAMSLEPSLPSAYYNLGTELKGLEQFDQAIDALQTAIRLKPDDSSAFNNLGVAQRKLRRPTEAIESFQRALRLKPDFAQAYSNLGNVLRDEGNLDAAIAAYQSALRLKPDLAETYNNLGFTLHQQGQVDSALAILQKALQLKPDYVEAHINMGHVCKDQGRIGDAIASYRKVLELRPSSAYCHSCLILSMHVDAASSPQQIHHEILRWNQQHAQELKKFIQPHANDRDPDRRLKIGYVSSDFCNHACAFFIAPLLRCHDHGPFEVFCYAEIAKPDSVTEKFQSYSDHWVNTVGMSDEKLNDLIRQDQIDILVDLKLHTNENRLLVFARKPAPIQVTWIGYPGSTGLSTVDYRLTDSFMDPPGLNDAFYTEESIRLPDCFWCYDPMDSEPQVNELPALKNGFVTFGCMNHFCKVNSGVLKLWAKVLGKVKNSRLIILSYPGSFRMGILQAFKENGIDSSRVEFVDRRRRPEYLKLFHQLDVLLDTFPYNGHTTTCDALWMGVPVVSLYGPTAVSRGAYSILANAGLKNMAAENQEDYVRIAADLAADPARLAEMRSNLREQLRLSPLMDAKRFARNVEAAYRKTWLKWCGDAGNRIEKR
ncbi:MAG TPA: tetratricopeptide repeat protein [Phycisphaerae bacterium]|nr:tetratricopeptide repeat protein [Phycisphaerae bacterium]